MLTADTGAQVGTNGTTILNSHLNELAYTILVENLEGVYLQNLLLEVIPMMLPIVAVRPLTLPLCLKNFRSSAKKYMA